MEIPIGFFVILALAIFCPGLFFMWKYAPWRKWVKGLLSIFLLISVILFCFSLAWILVFGVGYSPKLYKCVPLNSEWGKCTNTQYNFSFEYPAEWEYMVMEYGEIGFGPSVKNIGDFIISVSIIGSKSEEIAKELAKGYDSPQETTINGLYATKYYKPFFEDDNIPDSVSVKIVDGKITYHFTTSPDSLKRTGATLSKAELQKFFDHMVDSFVKERYE